MTVGELIKWSDDILLAHAECNPPPPASSSSPGAVPVSVDVVDCGATSDVPDGALVVDEGVPGPGPGTPPPPSSSLLEFCPPASDPGSRAPSFSACVQPSLDSGSLVDALQDAVKVSTVLTFKYCILFLLDLLKVCLSRGRAPKICRHQWLVIQAWFTNDDDNKKPTTSAIFN
jgi:hypothetical protein